MAKRHFQLMQWPCERAEKPQWYALALNAPGSAVSITMLLWGQYVLLVQATQLLGLALAALTQCLLGLIVF